MNGALVALLLAIAPRALDRPHVTPELFDVSIEPTSPPVAATPVIEPVAASSTPAARPRHSHAAHTATPAPIEPTSVDDLSGSGAGDSGSGDGDGGNGVGAGSGTGSPGVATTMPIPLGSRNAQLPYTREALVARTEGNVLVSVLVGANGKVSDVALARGLGHGLDAIALSLAAKLEFQPARDALGQPTTARITWKFHFTPPSL